MTACREDAEDLARSINPLHSDGADAQETIMRVVQKANG